MRHFRNSSGVAGYECAVLLAIAAFLCAMSAPQFGFELVPFARDNF
ncbi:MAG: hypothetical protein N2423_03880 [Novosphingobium sp.]|nr:hypothetical protein [Novosphingobium sp.]